jgi:hypothetical protein
MSRITDEIEDLKQLFAANNRTLLAEFDEKLDQKLEQKLDEKLKPLEDRLNRKIDDLADFVRESLDVSNEATGEQLTDHEQRIAKLEQAAV